MIREEPSAFREENFMTQTKEYILTGQEGKTINTPQRICAWCNKVMQEGTKPATHGMCWECLQKQIESLAIQRNGNG